MSHLDDQRDPAGALADPVATKASSWRFWAALVPDHPVWTGRCAALHFSPAPELATAEESPDDLALFQDTTH
jgi:hypothetical protein